MENADEYIAVNRACWNARTEHHLQSDFYDMKNFLAGESSLKPIELELLGDIKGKSILHLQCHFGQDTLSLARLGAKVTGVDLSDKAIDKARELATQLQPDAKFVCCDLYDLPQHLDENFDIVFTSYGTIGWLPDLDKWAGIVARYLKPGGQFIFVDFHPVVWMFDNDFTKIQYSYFKAETIEETEEGTYADKDAPITTKSMGWNHSIGEILGNLIKHRLDLRVFDEFEYSPYNVFPDMEEYEKGKFRIRTFGNKLPMVYAIKAIRY